MKHVFSQGFTVVEIIVSVTLASIFVIILIAGYQAIASQHEEVIRYAKANDIARMNLSKFRSVGSLGAVSCPTGSSNILGGRAEPVPQGNFQSLTQAVSVAYPRGCANPPQVVSVVEYGPAVSRERVVYASYAR